jgi:hypothetical protein
VFGTVQHTFKPRLRHYYPEREVLFSQKFRRLDVNPETLVIEAKQLEHTDSLAYIWDVFKQLSHMTYGTAYRQQRNAGFFQLQLCLNFPL